MKETFEEIPKKEKMEIPPEADSYEIDGWDTDNKQQQAYIQNVNRHLAKTMEDTENHGIIGCGMYYPWVTKEDEWAKALRKAEAATGYQASWHWNVEKEEMDEITDWETGERKPKESETEEPIKELKKTEGWYDKITEPYRKAYMARTPEAPKEGWRKSPKRKQWEAERNQRFEETLKRQQKMFTELLNKK